VVINETIRAMQALARNYLRQFFSIFLRECYRTWRQELLTSILVALASYILMVKRHDPTAWNNFKVALIASGIVLGGFAVWHLMRTPFLLHTETVASMKQESLSALENLRSEQKAVLQKVSPADWREISDKFNAMSSLQIGAQFQTTKGMTRWTLTNAECRALCTLAGTMLVTSSAISPHLLDEIRTESNAITRWLQFLSATTSSASYRKEYLTEETPSGERILHILGRIDNVPRESAAACIKCSAQELAG
jgi:hypothetical protein